jgi:hypothetical protein
MTSRILEYGTTCRGCTKKSRGISELMDGKVYFVER